MVIYCMRGYAYILHELFPSFCMKKLTFFDLKLPAQAHTSCQWSKFRYFWLKARAFLLDWPSVMAATKGYLELIFTYNKGETTFSVSGAVTTHAAFCLKASSPPSCQSLPFNPYLRLQSRELQANIYSWNEPFSPISQPIQNCSSFFLKLLKSNLLLGWKRAEKNKDSKPRARARTDEPKGSVFRKVGTSINPSYRQHTFQILEVRRNTGLLELE